MTPLTKPVNESPPPSKEKLIGMLRNGQTLNDVVQGFLDKFKMPYFLEVSNGSSMWEDVYGDNPVPLGCGILRDSISQGELHLNTFITIDDDTILMKNDARKMAVVPYEVLIVGDTGTGKEIIAKSMIGARKGVIKAVNCGGLPEHLIESELFGHVKGSFTGAEKDKIGLMAAAQDGVMFLDEVGELPIHVQAKLLRALQEKRIRKVGGNTDEIINCKFVCATNRNLKDMVKAGTFKKDLYARISTLELHIKSLPDRKEDILPITRAVIERDKVKSGEKFLSLHGEQLASGVLEVPYNVRSIQQYVYRYDTLGRVK